MTSPATRSSAAIVAHARQRKQDSRDRLLAAGFDLICARGLSAVSVEEIASAAGVNRLTFYRHFANKGDLAAAIFTQRAVAATDRVLAIIARDWRDRATVIDWLNGLFATDRAQQHIQRMFAQAFAETPALVEPARTIIRAIVAGLGQAIPAFALDEGDPRQHRRWLEAALLIFQILDQSRGAAMGTGFSDDPMMIEILADQFLAFAASE